MIAFCAGVRRFVALPFQVPIDEKEKRERVCGFCFPFSFFSRAKDGSDTSGEWIDYE